MKRSAPVRPVGGRGALIAVCDDTGIVLAYGSYLGPWELDGDGFVNAAVCVADAVRAGTTAGAVAFLLRSGKPLGVGRMDAMSVILPGTVRFGSGDLRLSVGPQATAGSWEEQALRAVIRQTPALGVASS